MTESDTEIYDDEEYRQQMKNRITSMGQVVYDRGGRGDSEFENGPMLVIQPNAGTVSEQDPETRENIEKSRINDHYDTSGNVRCVQTVFVTSHMSTEKFYTFPIGRLSVPEPPALVGDQPLVRIAQAQMLVKLMKQLEITSFDALEAGVNGKTIALAEEMTEDLESHTEDWWPYELESCPYCGDKIGVEGAVKSNGDSYAKGRVQCVDPDCGFEADEEWECTRTIVVSDDD